MGSTCFVDKFGMKSLTIFLGLLLIQQRCGFVAAEVVGALLLPHGAVMLDPTSYTGSSSTEQAAATALHSAGARAAQAVQHLHPDLVVLVTPHGVADPNNFVVYQHPTATGSQRAGSNPTKLFTANINIDTQTTAALVKYLHSKGHNISVLEDTSKGAAAAAAAIEPINLGWGEVIPWSVLGNPTATQALIMSTPARSGSETGMAAELLSLGKTLGTFFSQPGTPKTLILISADLAHTHAHTGTPPGPYGTSAAAVPFDNAMQAWVATGCPKQLLEKAASFLDDAKSCGFVGSVLLHGMLQAAVLPERSSGTATRWQGQVLGYGHPTYFGMMVALWTPQKQLQQQQLLLQNDGTERHDSLSTSAAQQEQELSQYMHQLPTVDYEMGQGGDDAGDSSSNDSSNVYVVDDVAELKSIRREAKAGWRAGNKYDLLAGRVRYAVV